MILSPADRLLRIVSLRKGRFRETEFNLRPGEIGLSLFIRPDDGSVVDEYLDAVRTAGKRGDLGVAVLPVLEVQSLGLRLVSTPGGTGHAAIDSLHVEARFPFRRRVLLFLTRKPVYHDFNRRIAPKLFDLARLLS